MFVLPNKRKPNILQLSAVLKLNEWISKADIIFQKLTDLKQLNSELACDVKNMDRTAIYSWRGAARLTNLWPFM